MRSVFRQNCFKKCVFRIGKGSLQFDTAQFKIANFKKRSAKRLAFCVFTQKRAFLTWKRGAKLTLSQREKRRDRETERNTNPRALLYLCDYLAKPTMAHGGYNKRRVKPAARRSKGLGIKKKPKPKSISLKNQIRSIDRMLKKVLLISRSVAVETGGSWFASTRSSRASGAAVPDFQSSFCSLSLSLTA